MEHLTGRIGIFTNLHLERNVPDVVQTKRYQRTLNKTVDTECHHWVLISRPFGEGLDSRTDWRPDEGEDHTQNDSGQTRDDWYKTLTGKEAQVFWQLNTEEAVKHVGSNGTGDNPPEYTGIRQMFGRNLFGWQMQHQWRNHGHGFHHDAVSHYRGQCRNAVVVSEAQGNTDSEDQRHIGEYGTAGFRHHV
ncbi:hypothetical protein D3C73_411230 [compost metagenome]